VAALVVEDAARDCGDALARWLAHEVEHATLPLLERGTRRLADAGDAVDDLLQIVACRALSRLDGCRARSRREFRGWLQAIARRIVIDLFRSPDPIGGGVRLPPPRSAHPGDPWAALGTGPAPTLDQLERALERLHPRYREILWKRAVEGMTWRQLGQALGISADAARHRFQRGRAIVRAMCRPEGR
jgi:RNA polymerase sigma-70 factor, ECF subfamily